MSLFDPGPALPAPEPMSAGRRRTVRQRLLLAQGINPGSRRPFAGNGETCGTCANLKAEGHNRTYYKCGLFLSTAGPGTDIRLSWPACKLWSED